MDIQRGAKRVKERSFTLGGRMARDSSTPKAITIRPTPEDYKIVVALCRKLGVNASAVIRLGLRLLAEKEKVKA